MMGVSVRPFTAYRPLPFLLSGNGPEFVAQVMQRWLAFHHGATLSIEPGCPWQDGVAESFTGILRDERLTMRAFASVADAGRRWNAPATNTMRSDRIERLMKLAPVMRERER